MGRGVDERRRSIRVQEHSRRIGSTPGDEGMAGGKKRRVASLPPELQ